MTVPICDCCGDGATCLSPGPCDRLRAAGRGAVGARGAVVVGDDGRDRGGAGQSGEAGEVGARAPHAPAPPPV